MSFIADGEFFTVDVTLVQKVARNMRVTPVPTAPDSVAGIANMKGRVVTVLSLTALLGREREKREGGRQIQTVHAVVFKSFTDGNDQMGLLIEKPGDLIDINEDKMLPPPLPAGANDENFCISGVAEIEGILYRIINVDSIIKRFKDGGENPADIIPQGGTYDE